MLVSLQVSVKTHVKAERRQLNDDISFRNLRLSFKCSYLRGVYLSPSDLTSHIRRLFETFAVGISAETFCRAANEAGMR